MRLNPDKVKVILVGSNSVLGSGVLPMLEGVALTPKLLIHSLGALLGLGLLFEG